MALATDINLAQTELEQLCINSIRVLAIDAVQKANSGHPGMPMGMAPAAYLLWTRFMRYNPANPRWLGRDRFVLSAGHGSMLLYALLYLTGYDLPLDEIETLSPARQPHARSSGVRSHARRRDHYRAARPGLRQWGRDGDRGQASGGAIRARRIGDGSGLFDHRIFAIASDGDLMEGVASEAASIAGHLGLGNIVYLYDDNHITIDGKTELSFSEDVCARFDAYGWHTQAVEDGNDLKAIAQAVEKACAEKNRPSLIRIRTHIGYGSPQSSGHFCRARQGAGRRRGQADQEELRMAA